MIVLEIGPRGTTYAPDAVTPSGLKQRLTGRPCGDDMPRDPDKAKARTRRYRAKKHAEKFGPDAGDMRGRHGNHARGDANAKWNKGISESSHGYLKIQVGKSHPLADPNGYAYLHHLVWVSAGNEHPDRGHVVHHEDENKHNNRLDNLEFKTNS